MGLCILNFEHFYRGRRHRKRREYDEKIIGHRIDWSFVVCYLGAACSKARPEKCSQGECLSDLNSLKLDGQVHTLQTLGPKFNKSATVANSVATRADNFLLDENYKDINNMDLVDYTSTPQTMRFLIGVPFRGKTNFSYDIKYEVTKDHLILHKIAWKEDLPSQEWSAAEELPDGRFSVPILGYKISLVRVEFLEDDRGELTERTQEFPAFSLTEATHIKVDMTGRKLFEAAEKYDVFPADLLDGEWFYASTIVGTSYYDAPHVGRHISQKFAFKSASRITFRKGPELLTGHDVNVDPEVDTEEAFNLSRVLELPVTWVDYEVRGIEKEDPLKETVLEGEGRPGDPSRDWEQRRFVKIDFAKAKEAWGLSRDNLILKAKLHDLEVAQDYLSFVVEYPDSEIRVRYSLLKAHEPIQGRVYNFQDLKDDFGFFMSYREYISDSRFYRPEDVEGEVFLNRFYPHADANGDRKIVFHFSHRTPKEFKVASKRIVNAWNEGFKEAGTGMNVVLDESKTVPLGDLRYNIINIVDTARLGGTPLGYGPSIADTQSGEIISATSNVWINPLRQSLIRKVRTYVRGRLGSFDEAYVNTFSDMNLEGGSNNSESLETSLKIHSFLEKFSKEADFFNDTIEKKYRAMTEKFEVSLGLGPHTKDLMEDLVEEKRIHRFGTPCSFYPQDDRDFIEMVEQRCGGVLLYVNTLKANQTSILDIDSQAEYPILESCMKKLLDDSVAGVLLHEMGHNFGLFHNFAASSDGDNFPSPKQHRGVYVQPRSSSTMDYTMGLSKYDLQHPGPYDVAAIRFGYTHQIEVKSGRGGYVLATIPPGQRVDKFLEENALEKRPYKYCSDYFEGMSDPLCKKWDYGANPEEVVTSLIENFNATYAVSGQKLDRALGPISDFVVWRLSSHNLQRMRVIYNQWRYHLAEFVTKKKRYLESYDEESYGDVLRQMENDPGIHGENFKNYFKASRMVYNFFKSLIQLPGRHCLVAGQEEETPLMKLKDFEELRNEIFSESGVTVQRCDDPVATSYLSGEGLVLINPLGHYGHYFKDLKRTLETEDLDELDFGHYNTLNGKYYQGKRDCSIALGNLRRRSSTGYGQCLALERVHRVGVEGIKFSALFFLTARFPGLKTLMVDRFYPNMMDEPDLRANFGNYLLPRVVQGLDLADFKKEELQGSGRLPKFYLQKDFLVDALVSFYISHWIPGKTEVSSRRLGLFYTLKTNIQEDIPEEGFEMTQIGGTFVAAPPSAMVSHALITTRNNLLDLQELAGSSLPDRTVLSVESLLEKAKALPIMTFAEMKYATLEQFLDNVAELKAALEEQREGPEEENSRIFFQWLFQFPRNIEDLIQNKDQLPPELLSREFLVLLEVDPSVSSEELVANFPFIFMKETLEASLSALWDDFPEIESTVKFYEDNQKDLKAHLDVLTESLIRF